MTQSLQNLCKIVVQMVLYHLECPKGNRKMNSFSNQIPIQNETLNKIKIWDTIGGLIKNVCIQKFSS